MNRVSRWTAITDICVHSPSGTSSQASRLHFFRKDSLLPAVICDGALCNVSGTLAVEIEMEIRLPRQTLKSYLMTQRVDQGCVCLLSMQK